MIRELKIGSARRMAVGGANAMIERGEVCCILKMCTSSIHLHLSSISLNEIEILNKVIVIKIKLHSMC